MPTAPLSAAAVKRNAEPLRKQLGHADGERLDALLTLPFSAQGIPLAAALQALFPAMGHEAAAAFEAFCSRLNHAATEAGITLRLEADTQTQTPPQQRWCWFAGDDGASTAAENFTAGEVAADAAARTPQAAIDLEEFTADGRRIVRYFISYAHKDDKLFRELLDCLQPRLNLSPEYAFEPWDDRELLIGERWRDGIERALARCHVGLLLVSVHFLGSRFITGTELPTFISSAVDHPEPLKKALPVALGRLQFDGSLNLKGLQAIQVFRHKEKSFQELKGRDAKDAFAEALYAAIRKALAAHFAPPR